MFDNDLERYDDSYLLDKGFVYLSKTPSTVQSVLGSAVAVCLWDKKLRIGAVNHFVKPRAQNPREATASYGNAAMIALYRMMIEAGSNARNMVAQVFGGATPVQEPENNTGHENVEVAKAFLRKKKIRIVSEDVGGNLGRKIVFETSTGRVAVLKTEQIRRSDWM